MIKGLPTSRNPYDSARKPSKNASSNNMSSGLGDIGSDLGGTGSMGGMDIGGDGLAESNAVLWEPFQLPNKQDLGFRRTDGFFLRARKFKTVLGKWIAQLYRNNKILDKGQVIVPDGYDAENFIKQIANYMLDGNSFRYQQDPSISPPEETEEEPTETITAAGQYEPIEQPEQPEQEGLEEPTQDQNPNEETPDISDLDIEELES